MFRERERGSCASFWDLVGILILLLCSHPCVPSHNSPARKKGSKVNINATPFFCMQIPKYGVSGTWITWSHDNDDDKEAIKIFLH